MNASKAGNDGRAVRILIVVAAMAAAIWFIGEYVRNKPAEHAGTPYKGISPLPAILETRAEPSSSAVAYTAKAQPGVTIRELKAMYERRAYHGAPPTIPHEVTAEMINKAQCNTCHERGGFAPPYQAYAPVTPHPEYSNCTQCHVPQPEKDLFVETEWASVSTPALHRPALPGSPPPIPHTLQLRDNCLACHAGPAAPVEIRTSHPERLNCVQCHAPQHFDIEGGWERPAMLGLLSGHIESLVTQAGRD